MHGQKSIDMIGMLLQQRHDCVGVKACLALLKQHLHCLQPTSLLQSDLAPETAVGLLPSHLRPATALHPEQHCKAQA